MDASRRTTSLTSSRTGDRPGCSRSAAAPARSRHVWRHTRRITAIDQSPRLARLTAGRGVPVGIADVQALPFPDNRFDVVAALWMLYHVPDLDRGLAEIRRVLRPRAGSSR